MSNQKLKTLNEFVIERQADFPYAKGELTRLLSDIAVAAKIVNREVNKAGLVDILGEAGSVNVQGEEVKKLDLYANDQFIAALRSGGECCGIASEENEEFIVIKEGAGTSRKIPRNTIGVFENLPSGMFSMAQVLTKSEIRDLMALLSTME